MEDSTLELQVQSNVDESGMDLNLDESQEDFYGLDGRCDSSCASVSSTRSGNFGLKKKDSKSNMKNKTFNYFQIREIEQDNISLMKKVLAHSVRPTKYKTDNFVSKISSAEINRRKVQKKIDHENLILLKKIQSIKPFGLSKSKTTTS